MAEKEKKQPKEQQKKVEEQPKEEKVENVEKEQEQEQPKAEEKKVEEQPKEDFASVIKELKDTQAKQVAEMQASYDAKLKERDEIIKQLIKGEQATNEGTSDVADLVNKNRNYKKW